METDPIKYQRFWLKSRVIITTVDISKYIYLKGFASNLWPMVTKLVSWFDMNQAREETLQSVNTKCC